MAAAAEGDIRDAGDGGKGLGHALIQEEAAEAAAADIREVAPDRALLLKGLQPGPGALRDGGQAAEEHGGAVVEIYLVFRILLKVGLGSLRQYRASSGCRCQ